MSGTCTVLIAERLFDGTAAAMRGRSVIVIQDDQIVAVGNEGDVDVPTGPDVRLHHLSERFTVMPGLIDSHTHLMMNASGDAYEDFLRHDDGVLVMQAAANAQAHLRSGVTTVADTGARRSVTFDLRDAGRLGLGWAPMPRLMLAGRVITRTGGHGWSSGTEADGIHQVQVAARQLLKEGADIIKIMATGGGTAGTLPHRPSYRTEELAVAADEAHGDGKPIFAHCSSVEALRRCLDAGIDVIFHCHFHQPDGQLRFDPEIARRLADSPVFVNPTLWVNGVRLDNLRQKSERETLTAAEQAVLQQRAERYAHQRENVGKLVDFGVKMIAGTDAGWGEYPFGDLVSELEEMVKVGMSPAAVLQAATRNAAEALGIVDQVGTLEPGKKADLLLVDGDPTQSISRLRHIDTIVLGGEIVQSHSLHDVSGSERG